MTTLTLQRLLLATATTSLLGCAATTTPIHDAHFGQAVLAARAQQTINPAAASQPATALGLDGRAASEAINRYHDSFKTPPPSFNVINIGGGLGTGQ